MPGVIDHAGRITMLSGTPMPNQPIEIYNIARIINWDAIDRMSLADFREYYYDLGGGMIRGLVLVTEDEHGEPIDPYWAHRLHWSNEVRNVPRRMDQLQLRLRQRIMVRRTREEVLSELPAPEWHVFPLATTPAMRHALKHPGWKRAEYMYNMDPSHFQRGIPIDGEISTARRLLGEAKAPAVAEYIESLFDSGIKKLVVAAHHHSVLDILRERLKKHGLVYMDGKTSPVKKQLAVDRFQQEDEIGMILGQTQTLGMGWTLTAAQDAVLVEPDWVPGNNEQLLLRICRMGQEGNYVLGHVPVIPDTLDERVLGSAIAKDINIHAALDA